MTSRLPLIVLGMGNTLREDDGVGIYLVQRLSDHFQGRLPCMVVYESDILLAETLAGYAHALIVDAVKPKNHDKEMVKEHGRKSDHAACQMIRVEPSGSMNPACGFLTHVFDWGAILTMADTFYGRAPETVLAAVPGFRFGISETLSEPCLELADSTFPFLADYCAAHSNFAPVKSKSANS